MPETRVWDNQCPGWNLQQAWTLQRPPTASPENLQKISAPLLAPGFQCHPASHPAHCPLSLDAWPQPQLLGPSQEGLLNPLNMPPLPAHSQGPSKPGTDTPGSV